MNSYLVCCQSHIGNIRKVNEDNLFCGEVYKNNPLSKEFKYSHYINRNNLEVYAVFDGMGGLQCGEKASYLASSTLYEYIKSNDNFNGVDAIKYINYLMCQRKKQLSLDLGCTAVICSVLDNQLNVFNIGDSRAYLFRNNVLKQLSVDHTEENSMKKINEILGINKRNECCKNILTQHIGIDENEFLLEPSTIEISLLDKDIVMLCSDGLTSMVSDEKIREILGCKNKLIQKMEKLINEAINNGGKDNITIILLEF